MDDVCTVTGVLSDARTVFLDQAIPLASGPVRVTVERLSSSEDGSAFHARLNEIRESLCAGGYRPRAREDVDAQIERESAAWDNG